MRERHQPCDGCGEHCIYCDPPGDNHQQGWPCDASRLLALLTPAALEKARLAAYVAHVNDNGPGVDTMYYPPRRAGDVMLASLLRDA